MHKIDIELVEMTMDVMKYAIDRISSTKRKIGKPKKEEELEQYSDGVKKRIAKLTKKWREAERQREEALGYAEKMILAKRKAEEEKRVFCQ